MKLIECTSCHKQLEISNFYKRRNNARNKAGYQQPCKPCNNGMHKARRQAKRDLCVAKLGGICVDCGTTERLEFDHVDPAQKSEEIYKLLYCSDAKLFAELAKCVLRCKPCHTIKTGKEQTGLNADRTAAVVLKPHGTPARYRQGCKCDDCLAAERARSNAKRVKYLDPNAPGKRVVELAEHGTKKRYNQGCRCDDCRGFKNYLQNLASYAKRHGLPAPRQDDLDVLESYRTSRTHKEFYDDHSQGIPFVS